MKKRTAETVTAENFDVYEKRVWRLACRQKKTLAGGTFGWLAGDVVFLPLFWAGSLLSFPVEGQPLNALPVMWRGLCTALWPGIAALREEEFLLGTLLAAIAAALAANLLLGTAVGLCWPGVKFDPVPGEGLSRAQELYRRLEQVRSVPPGRKWYISLVPAAVYGGVILVSYIQSQGGLWVLAEDGLLMSIAMLFLLQGALMLLFLLFYLPYRGLSGLLRVKLYDLRCAVCREYQMGTALWEYVRACERQEQQRAEEEKARQEAEERVRQAREAERRRLEGDALYREAVSGGRVDVPLIQQAAELGCRPACLYMGRQLMDVWLNGSYTREEELEIAGFALEYFRTAAQEEHFPESRAEGEFGRLMFEVILAGAADRPDAGSTRESWKKLHSGLRGVRAGGLLDPKYNELCIRLIDYAKGMADSAQENWEWETGKRTVLDYSRLFPPEAPVSYWDQLTDYRDVHGRRMTRREVEDLYG